MGYLIVVPYNTLEWVTENNSVGDIPVHQAHVYEQASVRLTLSAHSPTL